MITDVEYWVMRIVCPVVPGPVAPGSTYETALRGVKAGDYQIVNGDVVEPIVDFVDQEAAIIRAEVETRRTGKAHKVVLNAGLG